jgi:hypothetical protein
MSHYLAQSAIFLPKHPYLFLNIKYEYKKVGQYNSFINFPYSKITLFVIGFIIVLLLPLLLLVEGILTLMNAEKTWAKFFQNTAEKGRYIFQKTFFKPPPDDWDKNYIIIKEDIYAAYAIIKLCNKPIIIYGYEPLTEKELCALVTLKEKGWVDEYIQLPSFSHLFAYMSMAHLKVGCCSLVVLTGSHFELAQRFGFQYRNWFNTNLSHWAPREEEERGRMSKYTLLEENAAFNPYIQGTSIPGLSLNTILLISSETRPFFNQYVLENYSVLQEQATNKGFHFLHFPTFKILKIKEHSLNYLRYHYPEWNALSDSELHIITDILACKSERELYELLVRMGDLPEIQGTATLRYVNFYRKEATYTTLKIPDEDDKRILDTFFANYILQLKFSPNEYFYSLNRSVKDEEEQREEEELELKLREIFTSKNLSVSLTLLMKILKEVKTEDQELNVKVNYLLQNSSIITGKEVVSSILIDRNYRIFFPEYGGIELKMPTLSKVVYIFFLRHPEGIILKDIYLHKAELRNIYMRISSRTNEVEMEKSIEDLINPLSGSLNQKISRILHKLKLLMTIILVENYSIRGEKGLVYKIFLDRNLLIFSNENDIHSIKKR